MSIINRDLKPNEAMLKLLCQYIGLKEIVGIEHNEKIVSWFHDLGFRWIHDDETSWCSLTINWIAWKLGVERSMKLDARSWLNCGSHANNPMPGDVVVFWRENINSWKGHVGLFMGFTNSKSGIYTLGGNQNNEINITIYPFERLLGIRCLNYLK
jgi:uncharacterized protein (TIGR02594 family)